MVGFIRASEILNFLKTADDDKEMPTEPMGEISLLDPNVVTSPLPDDDSVKLERLKAVLRDISSEEEPRLAKSKTSEEEIQQHLLPDVPKPSDIQGTSIESDPEDVFYSTKESDPNDVFDREWQLSRPKSRQRSTPKYKSSPEVELLLQPDVPKPEDFNPENYSDPEDVFLQSEEDDNTFTGEFLSPEREEELRQHVGEAKKDRNRRARDIETEPGRRQRPSRRL